MALFLPLIDSTILCKLWMVSWHFWNVVGNLITNHDTKCSYEHNVFHSGTHHDSLIGLWGVPNIIFVVLKWTKLSSNHFKYIMSHYVSAIILFIQTYQFEDWSEACIRIRLPENLCMMLECVWRREGLWRYIKNFSKCWNATC